MPGQSGSRKAIVVGGGPIGCLAAIGLRSRSYEVEVYDKGRFDRPRTHRTNSFNLTLSSRGLSALSAGTEAEFRATGLELPQRVIHHVDGSVTFQPYGTHTQHHLLSVRRDELHRLVLEQAQEAGVRFFFGHECVGVDAHKGEVSMVTDEGVRHTGTADIVLGCDGANSTVRHQLVRKGARLQIEQRFIDHGYVELEMPPSHDGGHALLNSLRHNTSAGNAQHGLHVWPRGNLVLVAQPNRDASYTTTLFMPMAPDGSGTPSFETVSTPTAVRRLFAELFPDCGPHLPRLTDDFLASPPASLRTVQCFPYHHGRAVLLGDAAHTMVPFFGQGINCSFEELGVLFGILDKHQPADGPGTTRALAEYSRARRAPTRAITDLSLENLRELAERTDDSAFHVRKRIERQLHLRHPDKFAPLYQAVAFTSTPYDEVRRRHQRQSRLLDRLCDRFDTETETDTERIIDAYAEQWNSPGQDPLGADGAGRPGTRWSALTLDRSEKQVLVDTVTDRLLRYQDDLVGGKYPASYLPQSGEADQYQAGQRTSALLREQHVPDDGTDLDQLLTDLFDTASPSGLMHSHPGFMAQVPSGGLFQSSVGDFVARAVNRFPGVWAAAPGFVQLETNVVQWFCEMLGYGPDSFGYLTTGGSLANLMGLHCALEHVAGDRREEAVVYVSEQGHFSIGKALRIAGVGPSRVRWIPTGPDHRMDVAVLRSRIEEDRRAGLVPTCVVATAGTTNLGVVDDLPAVLRLCRQQDVWAHVDACLGGFFNITERGHALLAGIPEADSIAVDAHKSLFLPHGTAALLVKNRDRLREAFRVPGAEYIPEFTSDEQNADLCNYGPELTREVRGLTAWLPIKLHGIQAFKQALDTTLDLADDLGTRLAAVPGVDVVERGHPHLPVVAFHLRDGQSRTRRLRELICARGNTYVSTTKLAGIGPAVRACVLQPQTDRTVIDQLVADVRWSVGEIRKED